MAKEIRIDFPKPTHMGITNMSIGTTLRVTRKMQAANIQRHPHISTRTTELQQTDNTKTLPREVRGQTHVAFDVPTN